MVILRGACGAASISFARIDLVSCGTYFAPSKTARRAHRWPLPSIPARRSWFGIRRLRQRGRFGLDDVVREPRIISEGYEERDVP